MLLKPFLAFAALLAGSAAAAQPSALLEETRRELGAPGIAYAVWRDGRVVEGAAGERALGSGVAVEAGDPFHIGSIAKPFTATLAARLVEQGRLSWADTVGERLGAGAAGAYRDVTLANLLSHRGGISPDPHPQEAARLVRVRGLVEKRRAAAALMLSLPSSGRRYVYSNYSYVVAAAMIEAATGQSWEALMRAEVFAPLGLASAGFGPPGTRDSLDAPLGHIGPGSMASGPVPPHSPLADNPPFRAPAGGLHISMRDLVLFGAAHLRGDLGEETAFLSTGTWRFLHRPGDGGYAVGWAVTGGGALHHDGSNLRWFALLRIIPEERLVIAVAVNSAQDLSRSRAAMWRFSDRVRRRR